MGILWNYELTKSFNSHNRYNSQSQSKYVGEENKFLIKTPLEMVLVLLFPMKEEIYFYSKLLHNKCCTKWNGWFFHTRWTSLKSVFIIDKETEE